MKHSASHWDWGIVLQNLFISICCKIFSLQQQLTVQTCENCTLLSITLGASIWCAARGASTYQSTIPCWHCHVFDIEDILFKSTLPVPKDSIILFADNRNLNFLGADLSICFHIMCNDEFMFCHLLLCGLTKFLPPAHTLWEIWLSHSSSAHHPTDEKPVVHWEKNE